jgi:hypothetical protein
LLEFIIYSQNQLVFIRDLTDLTAQIMFDGWWASMNVGSQSPIGWNHSRHASPLPFYLHCGIEQTGSPDIICIICHQVLHHPSEHGTSPIVKDFLAKAHIPKLNKLTKSEVAESTSTIVDTTAFAILKRQGSCGMTIARLQKKFSVNSLVKLLLTSMTGTTL